MAKESVGIRFGTCIWQLDKSLIPVLSLSLPARLVQVKLKMKQQQNPFFRCLDQRQKTSSPPFVSVKFRYNLNRKNFDCCLSRAV